MTYKLRSLQNRFEIQEFDSGADAINKAHEVMRAGDRFELSTSFANTIHTTIMEAVRRPGKLVLRTVEEKWEKVEPAV